MSDNARMLRPVYANTQFDTVSTGNDVGVVEQVGVMVGVMVEARVRVTHSELKRK